MTSDDLFDALQRAAATNSKKDKLAIVQTLGDVREWLRFALDASFVYFLSEDTFPDNAGYSGIEVLGDADRDLIHALSDRHVTGDLAIDAVLQRLKVLTPKSQEVLRRILLKDLRCGVGVTIVNTAFPDLVFDPPYMRCSLPKDSHMDKWAWSDGIFVQLKADGMFANVQVNDAREVLITSRQGSPFPHGALDHLEQQLASILKPGTVTMGELTVYNRGELCERQIGNGILNSLAQGGALPEGHWVHFDAWDQIPIHAWVAKGTYAARYDERFEQLQDQITRAGQQAAVRVIDTKVVHSRAEALAIYKSYLARGLEGVICKHPSTIWRDGDSRDQVKFKLEVTVDLKIVGYRPGTPGKRTEKTFGAVVARTLDDRLEVGVSGFKRDIEQYIHEHRDELLDTVIAVKANGVMEPTGEDKIFSLFSPRFAELRRDKIKADTLEEVQAQFEQAVSA
jgi:DNA ligase-1